MIRILFLLLFVGCASCKKAIRTIDICQIFTLDQKAYCAVGDEKYELKFPDELTNWYAYSEESQLLLGSRLEECEVKGSLPRNDKTWEEMQVCYIGINDCSGLELDLLDGFFAVNSKGKQKIQDRLEFCTR